MPFGFYITVLRVTGGHKPVAEIKFEKGLNVISGASNTGKSYIFQCIDFLLGARKNPKEIEESKGYSTFELEIQTYDGVILTLKRTQAGNKYLIKRGRIDEVIAEEEYFDKLSDDPKNISTLLLQLCGFQDVELKKNQYDKVRLSFRDIAGLTLIDEQQIITEKSPVYFSNESIWRTKEQSLFYYLLTEKDAKNFSEGEDPRVLKNKINGKIELVKEMISKTQSKLEAYKGENTDDLKKSVEKQIDSLNLEYANYLSRIDELKKNRNTFSTQKTKRDSEILFKKELLDRFSLLRKHYLSDLDRLQFISEGNFLLNQLNNTTCPFCGTEINDSHLDCLIQYEKGNANLELAIKSEAEKINLKLKEINLTIVSLKSESDKIKSVVNQLDQKIRIADHEINESLTPVTTTLKERINLLFKEKLRLEEYNRLRDQITNYTFQLKDLADQLKNRTKINTESIRMNKTSIVAFCSEVERTLNKWKFPNITSIVFDQAADHFDLKINNVDRKSNGKGYRAVTYAAFVISTMRYCKNHGRPFSYLSVLDSPLTTFKDRDHDVLTNEISMETENSFFEDLSKMKDELQVIILDNKEPPEEIRGTINYIHFSGEKGIGRQGFFPA